LLLHSSNPVLTVSPDSGSEDVAASWRRLW
jgi:hypothetical protein